MSNEALAGLTEGDLLVNGVGLRADIQNAISNVSVERVIDGCPVLEIEVADGEKKLMKAGWWDSRITTQLGPYSFELAQIKKQGTTLTNVFEEITVANLRRNSTPRKFAAGSVTRAQAIREMVKETAGITFVDLSKDSQKTREDISRGLVSTNPTVPGKKQQIDPDDTWTATGNAANGVGARRFIRGPGEFVYAFDDVLVSTPAEFWFSEERDGIISIDYDWDIGKPVATATIKCWAGIWVAPPGTHVELRDVGIASGVGWIVSGIHRPNLASEYTEVEVSKPNPRIEEPGPDTPGTLDDAEGEPTVPGQSNFPDIGAGTSAQGFSWPLVSGFRLTSPFGMRKGKLHKGVDLAVAVGSPVFTAKGGVVVKVAKDSDGYGLYVVVQHRDPVMSTVYAHLSEKLVHQGQRIDAGSIIGTSGGTKGEQNAGNSKGPHLHFEVRTGEYPGNPVDPIKYLPAA